MRDYTNNYKEGQIIKYEVGHVEMHAKIHKVRILNMDICIFGKNSNLILKNCTDHYIKK